VADLLVVTGPPGAGTSTVAPLLAAASNPAALVPGDDFSSFWVRGRIDPWLPAAHAQNEVVVRAAAGACGTFVRGGCPVVHDGMVGPWFLPTATGGHRADAAAPRRADAVAGQVPGPGGPPSRARPHRPEATAHVHAEFTVPDVDPRHVVPVSDESPHQLAGLVLRRYRDGALATDS
jgi:hypothetical protein